MRVLCTWPIRRVGTVIRVEPDGRWLLSSEGELPTVDPAHCEPYEQPVLQVGDLLRERADLTVASSMWRVTGIGRTVTFVAHAGGPNVGRGVHGYDAHRWIPNDHMWRFERVAV